jgi:hypothetical protein
MAMSDVRSIWIAIRWIAIRGIAICVLAFLE